MRYPISYMYFLQPYNVFFLFFLGEAASWLFERAKKRDAKRKENKKSDWLFERASSRKRFHNLLTESEWYNRRLYNKYCDDGDCTTIDQVSQQSNQISMTSVMKFWEKGSRFLLKKIIVTQMIFDLKSDLGTFWQPSKSAKQPD